ncbi:Ig-like domain-containing protein [Erwinia sp. E_sp_B04_8]|uniref:Ig-like domain-containing protein n=1 Tax=unclassified Erwinia TaxID=2622719 RepID=UPI0030CA7AFA
MAQLNDGRVEILSRDDGKILSQASVGTSHNVLLNQPSVVKIHGTRDMVSEFERQGNDLILHMRDGSVVRYQQFFFDDVDGDHSELVFDDGVNPAEHALFPVTNEFADAQTAMMVTPEYESLGSIEPLLLADTGATTGVMTAAGIGALGLVGLGVGALAGGGGGGGGGDDDNNGGGTTPLTPTITLNAFTGDDVLTPAEKGSNQTLSGTTTNAEVGSTVTIVLNGKTYTTTVGAEGVWSISVPAADLANLPEGSNTVRVSVTNSDGLSASSNEAFTVQGDVIVPPGAPGITIATFADNDVLDGAEKQISQTISGSTTNVQQGQTVTVTLGGQSYTTTVGANGSWSLSVPASALQNLADGTSTISARVSNTSGTSAASTHNFTVQPDTVSSISIGQLSGDGQLNATEAGQSLTISGITTGVPANSVVSITLNGHVYSARVGADGSWSTTVPAADLQLLNQGPNLVTATVTLADGTLVRSSGASLDVHTTLPDATLAPPFGDGVLSGNETNSPQTLSGNTGTTGAGQTVTVTLGGTTYTGTVNANGSWTVNVPAAALQNLPQGSNNITVVVTDSAGNSATSTTPFNVVTTPPGLNVEFSDALLNQTDVTQPLTVSGQSTGGQTVTVTLNGVTYTTAVNPNGSWSVNVPASVLQQLPDGPYTVSVTSTDAYGNSRTSTGQLAVDTTPPNVSVAPISGDGYVNAGEMAGVVQITGQVEPGSTVLVRINGVDLTATVNPTTGAWSAELSADDKAALRDGLYTVTVTATDAAGNRSEAFTSVTFVTESANLPTITVNPLTGDGVLNGAEVAQNQSLTGTTTNAPAGSVVTLTLEDGRTFEGQVVAGGNWTIILPADVLQALGNGNQPFSVTVEDLAGNSNNVTGSFLVDVDVNAGSLNITPVTGDNALNATEAQSDLLISGTSEGLAANTALTVTFNGNTYTATTGADGSWTATVPAADLVGIANNNYTVTVSGTDGNGDPVSNSTSLTVRTTFPNAIELTPPFGDAILNADETTAPQTLTGNSGVTFPDQTVTVTLGGVNYPATVNAATGEWSLTLLPEVLQTLPDGPTNVVVTVSDSLGNSISTTTPVTVDTLDPALDVTDLVNNGTINALTQNQPLAVSGTAEAGTSVSVTLNGETYTAVTSPQGNWSLNISASTLQTLPDGNYDLVVTATDTGGNSTTTLTPVFKDTAPPEVTLTPVSGDGYLNAVEHEAALNLSGTTELGSTVVVTLNGADYPATVDQAGNWSVSVPATAVTALDDGTYTVSVQATDTAGNTNTSTQPLVVVASDLNLPTISVSPFTGDDTVDGAEKGLAQLMTGTTSNVQAGQVVTLSFNGETYTGSVDADGSWSVLVPATALNELANGSQDFSVAVSDVAGNPATTTNSFSVDNSFSAIAIGIISDDNMLNAVEAQNDLVIHGSSRFLAFGARILVRFNSADYETTTNSDGSWSVTVPSAALAALPNGDVTITATGTDVNGNVITTTQSLNSDVNPDFGVTLNTPFVDGALNGMESLSDQNLTGTTGVTGAGQTVSVVLGGITYTGTVDAQGNWSVTLPAAILQALPQGENPLNITVTDPVGNSASLAGNFTVDTGVPTLSLDAVSDDNRLSLAEQGQPLTLSGSGDRGDTITVTLNGQSYTATVDGTGSWSIDVPPAALLALTEGSYDVQVSTTDTAGNTAALIRTLEVDLTPPPVTVERVSDGYISAAESNQPLVVSGTGEEGSAIRVELNDQIYTAVVGPDGQWTLSIPADVVSGLNNGDYTLNVTASDLAGNTTLTSTTLTVDTTPPAIFVSDITANNILDGAEQQVDQLISGTTTNVEAGQQLTVTLNGVAYQTTVLAGGAWQVTVPGGDLAALANGSQTLSVSVTDAAGNTGTTEKTFSVDNTLSSIAFNPLSGDGYLNAQESGTALTVSGSSANIPADSEVSFTLGGNTYTATVTADGTWSLIVPAGDVAALAEGVQNATVSVVAGNGATVTGSGSLNVITETSLAPTLAPPFTDSVLTNAEAATTQTLSGVTGTAGDGQTVTVNIGGEAYNATVNSSGVWSLDLTPDILQGLPQGTSAVTVTATDIAGNTASITPAPSITVATTLPALSLGEVAGGDNILNAQEQGEPLVLSGTVTAGDTVDVIFNGTTLSATVDDQGNWTATIPAADLAALDDGPYALQIVAADSFGNVTTQNVPLAIDTALPTFTVNPIAGDNIIDRSEQSQPLAITGTASQGDSVTVTLGGQSYTTTAGTNGEWSVSVPATTLGSLTEGANTVAVEVTSAAGNSDTQTSTVTVDTFIDPAVIVNTLAGDDIVNAAEALAGLNVTGSVAESTTTVVVNFNGTGYPATVGTDGLWTAAIPASALAGLTDGNYALSVTATPATGAGVTVQHPITLETSAPVFTLAPLSGDGLLNLTEHGQPLAVSGTGDTGDSVRVTLNGNVYTASVDGDGNWSVTVPAADVGVLAEGPASVTVTVTDTVGNSTSQSSNLLVDLTPPALTLDPVAGDGILNAAEQQLPLTLNGTAGNGADITVTFQGNDYTTTVGENGQWTLDIPASALAGLTNDDYTLTVVATDPAGNSTTQQGTFTVVADVATLPTLSLNDFAGNNIVDGAEQRVDQLLSGTTTNVQEGQAITVALGGQSYTGIVQASGAWSVTVPAAALAGLSEGSQSYSVTTSDTAGNPVTQNGSFTVNTTLSGVAVDPVSGDGFLNLAEAGQPLTLSGTSVNVAEGTTLDVTLNAVTYPAIVGADGSWSVVVPSADLLALPDGELTVTVTGTDAAGNAVASEAPLTVAITSLPIIAPDAPFGEGTLNADEATNPQTLTGSTGVTGDGQTVNVVINGTTYPGTVDTDGTYSVTIPAEVLQALPQDATVATVNVSDAAGNTATTDITLNVDTLPPAVTIGELAGDNILNAAEQGVALPVSGTGEPAADIVVTLNGREYTTTVGDNGQWTLDVPAADLALLTDGNYIVSVTATDQAGNSTPVQSTLAVKADVDTLPTLTVNTFAGNDVLDGAEQRTDQQLTGSTTNVEPGQLVTVTLNGQVYTSPVQADGRWSVTLPSTALAALDDGTTTFTLAVSDAAGNPVTTTYEVEVNSAASGISLDPLSDDGYLNADEAQDALIVSGTTANVAEGSTITLNFNGQTFTTLVGANGVWNAIIPATALAGLPDGTATMTATVVDNTGTTITGNGTLNVHVSQLPLATADAPFTDGTLNGNEAALTQTLTGTTGVAGNGQTVTLAVGNDTYTGVVDANGNWSVDIPATALQTLPQGASTLPVTVTDVAGNSNTLAIPVNVDTVAPTLTLNTIAGDGVVNTSEAAGEITVSGGSTGAQEGQLVTVTLNGQSYTTPVDAAGDWTVQLPAGLLQVAPDGSYPLTVSLSDAAGNTATATTSVTVATETLQPTINTPFGDGYLNITEAGTDQTLSGTTGVAGAGQAVVVNINGVNYDATVDANGIWTVPVTSATLQGLGNGPQTLIVTATDVQGNTGEISTTIAVDLLAPTLTVTPVAGDNIINAAEILQPVSIAGTASASEAGQQVTITFNGQSYQQTVQSDGSWQLDLPSGVTQNLADATYPVTVTLTDIAGNSTSQTLNVTVDASAANLPTISVGVVSGDDYINQDEATRDLTLAGSTTNVNAGQTVTVTLNGQTYTALVQADGSWNTTVPAADLAALADGAQSFTASVTDSSGNPASTTHQVTVIAQAADLPTITIDPVTSDDVVNFQESRNDVQITGTSQHIPAGDNVTVTLNGNSYTATVDANGNWTASVPAADIQALDQGINSVTASGNDVAGNIATATGDFRVDTNAPVLDVTLGAGADGILNLAEALAGLVVSGTSEAGLSVNVTLNGKIYTTTVGENGTWSLTVPGSDLLLLPDVTTQVGVSVTDTAGNTTTDLLDLGVAINTLPALTLATPFVDGLLNATEAAAEQVLTGSATNLAVGTAVQVTVGAVTVTGAVLADGTWAATLPAGALAGQADGALQVSVTAVDAAGNPASTSGSVEVLLNTLPDATIVTPFVDGALNAAEAGVNQTLTGTTGIVGTGQTVSVTVDGNALDATVSDNGNWSAILTPDLAATLGNGTHTITVTVGDRAGNSNTETLGFNAIITGLPAPTLVVPFADGVLNAAEAAAGGALTGVTGIAGPQTVSVNINGTVYQAAVDTATGSWSLALPASVLVTLPDGNWPITVTATDSVGNSGSTPGSLLVAINDLPDVSINLPFGDGLLSINEATASQLLSGSTGKIEAGQTVTVSVSGFNNGVAVPATVDASGNWSLTLTPAELTAIGNGTHTVTVTATDTAGNSDSATLDYTAVLTAPDPTINTPFGDGILNISEAAGAITLTGTTGAAGANQGVQLRIDLAGVTYTGTVDASGAWTVNLPAGALSALTSGAHTVNVTVTDPAGNSTTEGLNFTAALAAPVPTLNTPFVDGFLNGTEAAAGATLTGTTGVTGADQAVRVTLGGTNYDATVATNGTWTLDLTPAQLGALPQTAQTVTVVASDAAGNTATVAGNFTVDTQAPTITLQPFAGDNALNYVESLTSQTLSGTTTGADAGRVVTVTIGTSTLTGVVQADGSWSVNVTPVALQQLGTSGTGTIAVSVSDLAGNTGTASATIAVDLTPPATPLLTLAPVSDDNIVNASDGATLTVGGTFANLPDLAGGEGTVTLTIDGREVGTYPVTTTDGNWSITVPNTAADLADGTHTISATLVSTGDIALSSSGQFLVDRTPPTLTIGAFAGDDVLNGSEAAVSQTISGTASVSEAGRAVTVTLEGKTYTAVVQPDGTWSTTVPSGDLQALSQAGYTISASLSDAAGNVTTQTLPITVDTGAPLLQVNALLGDNLLNATDILATQLLTGTASGAEGQTIGLYLGDSSPIATAVVAADGTFSIALTPQVLGSLTDGTLVFGLRVSDASGNQTDATLTVNKVVNQLLNFTVDSLLGDGFLNAADTAVAQTITGLATSAGIGATVSLDIGGTTLSARVGQDGKFAIIVPPDVLGLLEPGETNLNLVLTDAAGNTRSLAETVTTILDVPVIGALSNLLGTDNLLNIAEAAVTQTVGGTINAVTGSVVTVTLGAKSYVTTLQAGGQWSVNIPPVDLAALTSGNLSLGVKVVDPAGNTSSTSTTVGIFTAQPTISLSSIFGDGILNIADALTNQTISGVVNNVAAGTVINLNVGNTTVTATVGTNGAFTATVSPDILGTLTSGNLTIGASLTDAAGNTASATAGAVVKLTAPSITINPLFGDGLLNLADALLGQNIGGTITGADAGSRVVVSIGGTQFITTTAANGSFSLALSPAILQGLANGDLTVGVSVTDTAGNTTSVNAGAVVGLTLPTISLNPLFGDGVLNLLESLVTQTISGTVGGNVAVGSAVTINLGNTTVTGTVGQGGVFSAQVTPAILSTLLDGNLTVGVSVTDAVGNVSSTSAGLKVGLHIPPSLSLNTVFGDGVLSVGDLATAQTISGGSFNLPAGSTVSVVLNGKTYTTTVGFGLGGPWSLNVPKADLAALANGTTTVTVSATDAYGNTGTTSGSLSVTAQTPPTVTITSVFGDGLLSAADSLSAQTIAGTSTDAVGSTITVRIGATALTAVVGANGAWSVSVPAAVLAALPDGNDTVTASLTNAAGNAGTGTSTVLVGTHTLPVVALNSSTLFGGDHYLNLSEANVAETISGTSTNAVGSRVSVNIAGNILTTTVGANGAWSVTVPSATLKSINDGSQTLTVTLTDAAGNTSVVSDTFKAVTHNLPAIGVDPILSVVSVLLTGLTVSGGTLNLAPGTRLNVTLNGATVQTTTDILGRYSAKFAGGLLTSLSLASIVTVTAVDAAGNPASTSNTLLLGSLLPVATPVATAAVMMAVASDDAIATTSTHAAVATESTTTTAHAATADSTLITGSDTASTDASTTAASADSTTATAAASTAATSDDSAYTIGGVVITLADGQTVEGASVTGSSGDDTVTLNSLNFTHIDGGAGTDTLVLNGEHMTLDLTSLGLKVEHIEIIDLGKAGSNSVKLDLNEALNLTDSQANDLIIKGTLGDQVTLANTDGGVWATAGQRTVEGQTFDVYHNSALSAANTLGDVLVQHNLQVHVV